MLEKRERIDYWRAARNLKNNGSKPQNTESPEAQEKSEASSREITTDSFSLLTNNRDVTSNWLYEVTGFRETLIEMFLQEHARGATHMVLIDLDLDGLKKLNEETSHEEANVVMGLFADQLRTNLEQFEKDHPGIITFSLPHKPQAGGDEFKIMLSIKSNFENENELDDFIQKLTEALSEPLFYNYQKENLRGELEDKEWKMTASIAYDIAELSDEKNNLYDSLKEIAKNCNAKLDHIKINIIRDYLSEVINKGRNLDISEYIMMVTETFGNRRITPEALTIVLNLVDVKRVQQLLEQRKI